MASLLANSLLVWPKLGDYELLDQLPLPHVQKVHAFGASTDSWWILVSCKGVDCNMLVPLTVQDSSLRVSTIVDCGVRSITSIEFITCRSVYLGGQDGMVYFGRVDDPKAEHVIWLRPIPATEPGRGPSGCGPINAIAFRLIEKLMAYAIGCNVFLMRFDDIKNEWGLLNMSTPFQDPVLPVTCLAFHELHGKISLFVGSQGGLHVISICGETMRSLLRNHDHPIESCVVSSDNRYLAVSTTNHNIVIWSLWENGSLLDSAYILKVPNGVLPSDCPLPPVTITPKNDIIVGTRQGYLHFISGLRRERCGRIRYDVHSRVMELQACGDHIYLVAVNNSGLISVACYTGNADDLNGQQAQPHRAIVDTSMRCLTSLEETLQVRYTSDNPTFLAPHVTMAQMVGSRTSYRAWELGLLMVVCITALSLHFLRGSLHMYLELDFIGNVEALTCIVDCIQEYIVEYLFAWFERALLSIRFVLKYFLSLYQ